MLYIYNCTYIERDEYIDTDIYIGIGIGIDIDIDIYKDIYTYILRWVIGSRGCTAAHSYSGLILTLSVRVAQVTRVVSCGRFSIPTRGTYSRHDDGCVGECG